MSDSTKPHSSPANEATDVWFGCVCGAATCPHSASEKFVYSKLQWVFGWIFLENKKKLLGVFCVICRYVLLHVKVCEIKLFMDTQLEGSSRFKIKNVL